MNRIKAIDGLRACAVLGVMWAHVWMFFGNPKMNLWKIDINRILSFGGVGVDLFFVISGFCMYLMYEKKVNKFIWKSLGEFIIKRWKRIAPAFYVVVLVDCIIFFFYHHTFPFSDFISHLFFLNTFYNNHFLSPPYWSLSTEWQFYLVLPFLFLFGSNNKRFNKTVFFLSVSNIVCLLLLYKLNTKELLDGKNIAHDKIWYRFIEFSWGILCARIYINNFMLPFWLKGNVGFLLSFIIAFSGKLLGVQDIFIRFNQYAFISRALSEPVLTFGYGLMILNLLNSESVFNVILSSFPFQFIGRISYSVYLWHWIIAAGISDFIIEHFSKNVIWMQITFFISLAVIIPVSYLSYHWLEAPYFKKR